MEEKQNSDEYLRQYEKDKREYEINNPDAHRERMDILHNEKIEKINNQIESNKKVMGIKTDSEKKD